MCYFLYAFSNMPPKHSKDIYLVIRLLHVRPFRNQCFSSLRFSDIGHCTYSKKKSVQICIYLSTGQGSFPNIFIHPAAERARKLNLFFLFTLLCTLFASILLSHSLNAVDLSRQLCSLLTHRILISSLFSLKLGSKAVL